MGKNKLFKKAHSVRNDITNPFGYAKDRAVTPTHAPTATSRDRVSSVSGAPNKVLKEDFVARPKEGEIFQRDGTLMTKLPPNVGPGPSSLPWWRRNARNVEVQQDLLILRVNVPAGRVYKLSKIGHSWYDALDEFWIIYDGKTLNEQRWNYQLGTPIQPFVLPVTVTATDSIECYVRNLHADAELYEFMLIGWYDTIEHEGGSRT